MVENRLKKNLSTLVWVFIPVIGGIAWFKEFLINQNDPDLIHVRSLFEAALIMASAALGALLGFDLHQRYGNKNQ